MTVYLSEAGAEITTSEFAAQHSDGDRVTSAAFNEAGGLTIYQNISGVGVHVHLTSDALDAILAMRGAA